MIINKKKYHNFSLNLLNKKFIEACKKGDFELVQFLTGNELKKKVNIHINGEIGFKLACKNNHLNIVSFLLTSPNIKRKPDINIENDSPIRQACVNESIDVLHYLLTSEEIKKRANIYALNNWAVKNCIKNKQKRSLEYLILNYKIKLDKELEEYINSNDIELKQLIEKRDLNTRLQNNLSKNNTEKKIFKI